MTNQQPVSRRGAVKVLGALVGGTVAGVGIGTVAPVAALNDPDRTYGMLFGKVINPKDFPGHYVLVQEGDTQIQHLGGIPWEEAPVPPKGHTCFVQTDAWFSIRQIQRCACGAIRGDEGVWLEINSR